ncbi:MAG: EamA family transporter [Anaerolineae bacterium]|nr:EamA family transporter [Anaerolineae bacterium]
MQSFIGTSWWFYALLAAVFAALTTIFGKIGVEEISSDLATAIRTVIILLLAWGIVFARREQVQLATISQRTLIFLVLSGLATGASWLFYFRALQLGNASWVAPLDKLSLVFILILSVLFLGDPLTWKVIVGSLLIVVGTLMFTL